MGARLKRQATGADGGGAMPLAPCFPPLGFTLVELVAMILIAGILAAVAGPRFFTPSTFAARGYADAASGFLRYAQKLAIARHGTVTVQIDNGGLALCSSASNPCADANPWPGPQCETPYRVDVPAGVSQTASAATLSFDAQGRPTTGLSLGISGEATHTLTVEAETGYVY